MKNKPYQLEKEFGTKWLSALRSGEYSQGMERLRDEDNNYCCLGVACVIVSPKAQLKDATFIIFKKDEAAYRCEDDDDFISERLYYKIPKALRGNDGLPCKVASLNDNGSSFKEIADWIEENVELV